MRKLMNGLLLLALLAAGGLRAADSADFERRLYELELRMQVDGLVQERVGLAEQRFQNQLDRSWLSLLAVVATSLAALGLSAWALFTHARAFAQEQVHASISDIVLRNKELVRKAIDLQALESQLLAGSRLCLASGGPAGVPAPVGELLGQLRLVPAQHLRLLPSNDGQTLVFEQSADERAMRRCNLLFLDNSDKALDPDLQLPRVSAFIGQVPEDIAVFYFGPGRVSESLPPGRQTLLSFASARSQIYGNLLNLLKTQARLAS